MKTLDKNNSPETIKKLEEIVNKFKNSGYKVIIFGESKFITANDKKTKDEK